MSADFDGISRRIRELTDALGWSLPRLARDSGIPQTSVYAYAKGRMPPADAVARICNATGAQFEWLLTGRGNMLDAPSFESRLAALEDAKAYSREAMAKSLLSAEDIIDREAGVAVSGTLVGLYDATDHLNEHPFVVDSIRSIIHIAAINDREGMSAVKDALRRHDPGAHRARLLPQDRV